MKAKTTQNQMEFVGVLVRGLMRCQNLCPGTAPSRLKAKTHAGVGGHRCHAAEALGHEVIEQQELCPTVAQRALKITPGLRGWPRRRRRCPVSEMADVMAEDQHQPRDRVRPTMELTMPLGAAISALRVSSDIWAEAS